MNYPLELTEQEAALAARQLLRREDVGTLITLDHSGTKNPGGHIPPHSQGEKELEGFPFGIVEYYVDLKGERGNPVIFISKLQKSFVNFKFDNRVALTIRTNFDKGTVMTNARVTLQGSLVPLSEDKIEEAQNAFVEAHHDAKWWIHFKDFEFYQLKVQRVYWVGGFGGSHYIGYVNPEWYSSVSESHLLTDTLSSFFTCKSQTKTKILFLTLILALLFLIALLILNFTIQRKSHSLLVQDLKL
jgi:hypothetical protein